MYYGFSFSKWFWRDFQQIKQFAERFVRLGAFSDGYCFIEGVLSAGCYDFLRVADPDYFSPGMIDPVRFQLAPDGIDQPICQNAQV